MEAVPSRTVIELHTIEPLQVALRLDRSTRPVYLPLHSLPIGGDSLTCEFKRVPAAMLACLSSRLEAERPRGFR